MKRAPKGPIKEPQRKTEPAQSHSNAVDAPSPANGSGGGMAQPAPTVNTSPNAVANGSRPKLATLRGLVGPSEPDASGNTIHRNSNGVAYVVFKLRQNGSANTIYCNNPELMPEIARRQGHEVEARVAVVLDKDRQYYVLSGFVEG